MTSHTPHSRYSAVGWRTSPGVVQSPSFESYKKGKDEVADVQAIKVYVGVELQLPSFLVLALNDVSSQLYALAAFAPGK